MRPPKLTPETASARFSANNRTINAEDEISLLSVGIDVGSSTSHLVFSRILMERRDTVYVVKARKLLFESEMLLTPYLEGTDIDADALQDFFANQYRRAGLSFSAIDAGALILTGVAAQRRNSRALGAALAQSSGKFVAVSAGDWLETTLVAHGAGAVQRSARVDGRILHVDIGGGTSKIAVCSRGEIVDRTAVDVGARLIAFDGAGRVTAIEAAGRRFAAELGIELEVGSHIPEAARSAIAERMAERLIGAMMASPSAAASRWWMRMAPLRAGNPPDAVTFSGGVAEYMYNNESAAFGDLGPLLAAAVMGRARRLGLAVHCPAAGIRATVLGASQYTVQLSGSTIFVAPESVLPLRNVCVVRPKLGLDAEWLESDAVAAAIGKALERIDVSVAARPSALCFDWRGSASFQRLDAFCRGVLAGLAPYLRGGLPLVLATDADVGGLLGMHLQHECGASCPIVSIDGLRLGELDFLDIGALIDASGAVPVVIKSLVFPHRPGENRPDRA